MIRIPRECVQDLFQVLERHVVHTGRVRRSHVALILGGVLGCWFLYAPIHELLHAAGCVLAGGEVQEVYISPRYGASIYAAVFPFVKAAESGYAGRLTKFDVHGSDLAYLVTDYFPFLLTVLAGYPLVALAGRAAKSAPASGTFLAGAGLTLLYVPLMQIPNDFYEMASILITRAAGAPGSLRSDDAFVLLGRFLGLVSADGTTPMVAGPWMAVGILAGLLLATVLALLTWKASKLWSGVVLG